MTDFIESNGLRIARSLHELLEKELCPGTGVNADGFWKSFREIVRDLGPKNKELLAKRDDLQKKIDSWHREHAGAPIEMPSHRAFLEEIGYLIPEGAPFQAGTQNVDREIAQTAGPQLVVPVDNPRYALNAANARWGSLYDALYGTDVISNDGGAEKGTGYNEVRGAKVIAYVRTFLDQHVSLAGGIYADAAEFILAEERGRKRLTVQLQSGQRVPLAKPEQFAGYTEAEGLVRSVLLRHHGLHIEIQIDRSHPIGREDLAGVKDVVLEAAITTIQDCEDSVAAVDSPDKTRVYRNWLGLMNGTLETVFEKSGRSVTRTLNADRVFRAPDGSPLTLPGRSLLLIRNVGIHMYTDAVTTSGGQPVPEGFLDAMMTTLAAVHDLQGLGKYRNSRSGSVYIVKPKLHGPEEVAATVELFGRVEDALGLARNTVKMGIMDEERRTTVNLQECIRQANERVVFINTGFLDRTGDEIHTGMEAGPVLPKVEIKNTAWMLAYEDQNVDIGLETGLRGRAQIGKGMWTMPDRMRAMVEAKVGHPRAGANTAWVPSPTGAVLHAMHYHAVDVAERQAVLATRVRARLEDILTPPLLLGRVLSAAEIQRELDNNAQGILGYVVRWVEQGIGCSKIPDINDIGLMEDRATLRISSQHLANWLHHGIVSKEQVIGAFKKMAVVVDRQNVNDAKYRPMSPEFERSVGFQAALDLVFEGRAEPNGYTERVLTRRRLQAKSA